MKLMHDIVVIDDDPFVAATIAEVLADYGEVVCAKNPAYGLTLLRSQKWSLAIIDVHLQMASGIELAEVATEMDTPVMMITGCLDSVETMRGYGFPCVAKPFRLHTFALDARLMMLQAADTVMAVRGAAAAMREATGNLWC
jgi:DNA-binding response OmpR family regulator